jgi:hypothetical protein
VQGFTSQLAVMIRAGISLRAAVEGISDQIVNPKFKVMLSQMKKDLESGFFPERSDIQTAVRQAPVDDVLKAKYRVMAEFGGYTSFKSVGSDRVFDYAEYRNKLNTYEGDVALVEEISEYAASGGPMEAFAEVFRIYCTEGPGKLGPATLQLFKTVVASGGARLAAVKHFSDVRA